MLVPELKSFQRHPPSPKELGETEVKSRKKVGCIKEGVVFLLENINWVLLIVEGSMFNRQHGDPNISKLLQLIVNFA